MSFFFSIFIFVAIFSYWEIRGFLNKGNQKNIYYFLCFIFFCLSFLRWEYGTDWKMYLTNFSLALTNVSFQYEPLYHYIVVGVRSITDNYSFLLFCFSAILYYCQTKGIAFITPYPITTLLVLTGIVFCNVGYVRQTIAEAILLYSCIYIIKRRIVLFVLFVVIAMGFHRSAIIFLPVYWIFNLNINQKKFFFLVFCSLLAYAAGQFLVPKLTFFLSGSTEDKFEYYMENSEVNATTYNSTTLFFKSLINRLSILLVGYYILFIRKEFENSHLKFFFNLYCFSLIMYCLFFPVSISLARLSNYYDFQFLILPFVFLLKPVQRIKSFVFVCFVLYLMIRLYVSVNAYEGITDHYFFIPEIEQLFG